ncbi:hypothetical protein MANES_12G052002v8 [Manihot esculenta]|uniref:Uncharacterized protein n=1 Tax=Manihot esculenta TaxID=3983 RepID=A0ACB7GNZ3_MANES|nr:hypothetical protein MANES_12G052002v8 [Manihot esculenta]
MDIEPLWALGGWLLFSICMAKPNSKSSISETNYTKSHHFFLFFALLIFIFLLLIIPTKPINQSSSISIKRVLFEFSSESTSTTMNNLHPKQSQTSRASSSSSTKSKGSEFGAEAHEVPSGPNPISNR